MLGFPHSVRRSLSQTGPFPHRTPFSALRTSLARCALPLRAISALAWDSWAMVLDGPFPQFRSHGRIDGTGPGNFRARLSSPSARRSCRCCKQSLRCMSERGREQSRRNSDGEGCAQPALCTMRKAEARRAIAAGAVNVELSRREAQRSAGLSTTDKPCICMHVIK